MKIKAGNYLSRLQQKIQHNASQIDNYLEQRVVILENMAALVNKATKLDEETFKAIAQARAGGQSLNEKAAALENVNSKINVAMEAYPELKANSNFVKLQEQLQDVEDKIQAARRFYNAGAKELNTKIKTFPTNFVNSLIGHFKKRDYFEVADSEKAKIEKAPEVKFDK